MCPVGGDENTGWAFANVMGHYNERASPEAWVAVGIARQQAEPEVACGRLGLP